MATEVTQAELSLQGDHYVLSADIDYHFSDKAKEALQNGVPLFWDIQVKIQQGRKLLWDKTITQKALRYRIQYHALLNMYRVSDEMVGTDYNFSTFSAALGLMSAIHDFRVMDKADLDSEQSYVCMVKVNFDRAALPLPLRPIAHIDPQWYLSSDWTIWPLKK